MQIERIIQTNDWVRDQERVKTYRIYEDSLGTHHIRYEEQIYAPYSNRGLPVVPLSKGSLIDKMI